jgi:hypothetical protein
MYPHYVDFALTRPDKQDHLSIKDRYIYLDLPDTTLNEGAGYKASYTSLKISFTFAKMK